MAAEKKGCVPVAWDGLLKECLGIVTTSQIILKIFFAGRDAVAIAVGEIMKPSPLVTIDPDASTWEAARLIKSVVLLFERQTQNLNSLMVESLR